MLQVHCSWWVQSDERLLRAGMACLLAARKRVDSLDERSAFCGSVIGHVIKPMDAKGPRCLPFRSSGSRAECLCGVR